MRLTQVFFRENTSASIQQNHEEGRQNFKHCPLYRSARCSFASLQKERPKHRSYVWNEALSGMVFVPVQKLSGSSPKKNPRNLSNPVFMIVWNTEIKNPLSTENWKTRMPLSPRHSNSILAYLECFRRWYQFDYAFSFSSSKLPHAMRHETQTETKVIRIINNWTSLSKISWFVSVGRSIICRSILTTLRMSRKGRKICIEW